MVIIQADPLGQKGLTLGQGNKCIGTITLVSMDWTVSIILFTKVKGVESFKKVPDLSFFHELGTLNKY